MALGRLVNGQPSLAKDGKPKQDLKYDFTRVDKFRFGRYTAKLLVVYNDGKQDVPIESELSFWVIPWKILLVLLVIVSILGYGLWAFGRSFLGRARGSRKNKTRG